ncbi:MAG: hypothetical protein F6K28_49940 [Microcoleus sp. SIO2G3]|nr:hypothetical protein [Microcoleus sp. SIO2G3]
MKSSKIGEPVRGLGEDWSRRFPPAKEVRVSPSRGGIAVLGSPQVERLPSSGVDLGGIS